MMMMVWPWRALWWIEVHRTIDFFTIANDVINISRDQYNHISPNPGWWCTWARWWRGRWSAPRGSVPQSLSQGLRIYFWCQCVGMCLCMFIMKVGNFLHVSHKKWALCICLSVCDTLTVCCHLLYLSLIQISYSAQSTLTDQSQELDKDKLCSVPSWNVSSKTAPSHKQQYPIPAEGQRRESRRWEHP